MRSFVVLLALASLCFAPAALWASDHADPALPSEFDPSLVKEPNITGLFVFPEGDQLVLVFNVYRSLSIAPPYDLEDYEFVVYADLHSKIDYSNADINARYGGHVVHPEGISPDVTIDIQLSNQATLAGKKVEGLKNPEAIRWYAGVRDDPFIFTPFFGVNVIAMVMSIPLSSFPEGQQDWIFWGVTRKKGSDEILDHVGRGLRTQLPRFGPINTLPPSQHVAKLDKLAHGGMTVEKFIMEYLAPLTNLWDYLLAQRYYDMEPDVCIYTSRHPSRYPNGRRLEDDIAGIACDFGDCILVELSIAGDPKKQLPRPTVNDKPLLAEFPYLAEPWPEKAPPPVKRRLLSPTAILILLGLLFLANVYFLWRGWRCCRRLKAAGL